MLSIVNIMCDYMYYEYKHKSRIKNPLPETEPELEKVEEPIIVKA